MKNLLVPVSFGIQDLDVPDVPFWLAPDLLTFFIQKDEPTRAV